VLFSILYWRRSTAQKVVFLGPDYPKRLWTKFESDQFRDRFGQHSVIPIWFTTAPPGLFDESLRVGGVTLDPGGDVNEQLGAIAEELRKKMEERAIERARGT